MHFSETIISWYEKNKRNLPWRETNDPFKIWLSEIIMQQTRIEQGEDYYQKFIERFDNIKMFAEASEEEVLKLWQGLGYYSRALNAHAAAKEICSHLNGKFPSDYESLSGLKGIGRYTASAILSIAFNKPYAVVDGNVNRFISRLFGIALPFSSIKGENFYYAKMDSLLDKVQPGVFNQAVMEFGALVCTPKNPNCSNCTFAINCIAFLKNKVLYYPVKIKPAGHLNLFFNYLLITDKKNDVFYLSKRNSQTIWKNMYELPLIETPERYSLKQLRKTPEWGQFTQSFKYTVSPEISSYKHILSHRIIYARFYLISASKISPVPDNLIIVSKKNIHQYAIPRLIERFFKEKNIV